MPSAVAKSLSRLSRTKLLDLCASWANSSHCEPYLTTNRDIREIDEEDYLHEPAASRSELRKIYAAQKENHQCKSHDENWSKKDLVDRIVDGDWRRGLSYEQLASIDFAALEENDTTLRWSALKLVPLEQSAHCSVGRDGDRNDDTGDGSQRAKKRRKLIDTTSRAPSTPQHYPHTTAAEFVRNLRTHISPLVKVHVHVHRLAAHNLSVVRLCIVPSTTFAPLSTNIPRSEKAALDGSRILFIALPDSCPYVYVSMSGAMSLERSRAKGQSVAKQGRQMVDAAATKRIILEAIPKALSRPQQRWALQSTNLTAKSLRAMTLLRGNCRPGVSGGVFSGLGMALQTHDQRQATSGHADPGSIQERRDHQVSEHGKRVEQRFGAMQDGVTAKLDRVQFRVKDLYLQPVKYCKRKRIVEEEERHDHHHQQQKNNTHKEPAPITITFSGADVFAGLKQLATLYPDLMDLDRLPSVFTGEGGTSFVTL